MTEDERRARRGPPTAFEVIAVPYGSVSMALQRRAEAARTAGHDVVGDGFTLQVSDAAGQRVLVDLEVRGRTTAVSVWVDDPAHRGAAWNLLHRHQGRSLISSLGREARRIHDRPTPPQPPGDTDRYRDLERRGYVLARVPRNRGPRGVA
jgi:hypothetical protein